MKKYFAECKKVKMSHFLAFDDSESWLTVVLVNNKNKCCNLNCTLKHITFRMVL